MSNPIGRGNGATAVLFPPIFAGAGEAGGESDKLRLTMEVAGRSMALLSLGTAVAGVSIMAAESAGSALRNITRRAAGACSAGDACRTAFLPVGGEKPGM